MLGDVGSLGTQSFTSLELSQDDECAVEAVAAGDMDCGEFPWRTPAASGADAVRGLGVSRWSTTILEPEGSDRVRQDVLVPVGATGRLGREMQDHVMLCGGEQVASSSDGGAVLTMTTDDGTTLVVDVIPSSTSVIASTGPTDGLLQLSNTARQRLPA